MSIASVTKNVVKWLGNEYTGEGTSIDKIVKEWLSMLDTTNMYLLHVGTMLSIEQVESSFTGMGSLPLLGIQTETEKLVGQINTYTEFLNEAFKYVLQPNISGITIFAESEKCSRTADVSEKMVLSIGEGGTEDFQTSKAYMVDNNVPHLRTWTLSGYIMSSSMLSRHLIVKPDIFAKTRLLDKMMLSRIPVLYKTSDMMFYKVLISSFEYEYDPKSTNSVKVDITLKEFKTMNVTGGNVSKLTISGLIAEEQTI